MQLLGKLMTDMLMMRDESRALKTGGTNTPRDPVGTSQQASLAAASARVLMQVRNEGVCNCA